MAKVKLTAGRIEKFKCEEDKAQSFLWCAEVPGLGIRATPDTKAKRYIFQSKVKGQSMRITIEKVSAWSIEKAQEEARTAASGRLVEPRKAHNQACAVAGLDMTLHGLRRSFATLSEWTETPAGIAAQIQDHKPQGVREQNYIRRPLDLLRMWHIKIEAWMLEQAGVEFVPVQGIQNLRVVK
ncbi:integrase family protein [Candidatus Methylobacter oryzae]|uniref:Integrase family protein n=1 Tax=Candidatus Methylobacter oryzae TaxID=2497749 RepID=A0ABY3CGG2_9GAMM|nr:integrase family protein [Candidatus Methylobacter oryzae]TRX02978.1 integrase family protein [Candidatus Methylobacter oryzae]